jgi:hypothetical protein
MRTWQEEELPPELYGDLAAEQEFYITQSEAASLWFELLPARAKRELTVLQVRCPVKGCLIAEIFGIRRKDGGVRFLFHGKTSAYEVRNRILNWGFSNDWSGPPVWFPVGCRHGHAKLERAWLLDLVDLVREWHHSLDTVEEPRAKVPEAERRGIRRRTFHPKPQAWRGK